MNKIGSLYQIKEHYWLLFPNKEIISKKITALFAPELDALAFEHAIAATATAAFLSKRHNCNVSYVSPEEIFVLLETDGKYKKLLTTKGEMGWVICGKCHNECFE